MLERKFVDKPNHLLRSISDVPSKGYDLINLVLVDLKIEAARVAKLNAERKGRMLKDMKLSFTFEREELQKIFQIERRDLLSSIEKIGKDMVARTVTVDERNGFKIFSLLSSVEWNGVDKLTVTVNKSLIAHYIDTNDNFARIDFNTLFALNNVVEKRIFEWISRFKYSEEKYFNATLEDYCEMLGVQGFWVGDPDPKKPHYKTYTALRNAIFTRPIANIIKVTTQLNNGTAVWKTAEGCKSGIKTRKRGRKMDKDSWVFLAIDYIKQNENGQKQTPVNGNTIAEIIKDRREHNVPLTDKGKRYLFDNSLSLIKLGLVTAMEVLEWTQK